MLLLDIRENDPFKMLQQRALDFKIRCEAGIQMLAFGV